MHAFTTLGIETQKAWRSLEFLMTSGDAPSRPSQATSEMSAREVQQNQVEVIGRRMA